MQNTDYTLCTELTLTKLKKGMMATGLELRANEKEETKEPETKL